MEILSVVSDILIIAGFIILGLILRSYLPSYFGTKGKNLATIEDIEEITQRTEKARQFQQRNSNKISAVEHYLSLFARLIELYRFYARQEGHREVDDAGQELYIETSVVPDSTMAEAFQAIEETSLKAAIDQSYVDIRMLSGEISDIMIEIDKSGGLWEKFIELFGHLWSGCAHALEHQNFEALVEHLKDASNLRRAIYLHLQEYQSDL